MTIKINKHLLKINPNDICGVDIHNNKLRFGTYQRAFMQIEIPNNITQEDIDKILKAVAQSLENGSKIVDLDALLKDIK